MNYKKMKTERIPCPCGGFVEPKKEKVIQGGVNCGVLEVELCNQCGTQYLPEESMLAVEEKLKKAGLWGVQRKEIKFWKTGNTYTNQIPASFVQDAPLPGKGYIVSDKNS